MISSSFNDCCVECGHHDDGPLPPGHNDVLELVIITPSGEPQRFTTGATRVQVQQAVRQLQRELTGPIPTTGPAGNAAGGGEPKSSSGDPGMGRGSSAPPSSSADG